MTRVAVAGVLMSLLAMGCTAEVARSPSEGPHDRSVDIRPDLIVAEPARVASGKVVSLTFPEQTVRGIHFVLERQSGDTWDLVYHLLSSADLSESSFFRPGEEDIAIPDIGITGRGPDRVPIPDDVAPGSYRICTANAGDEFCAAIEVVDD
jgi:hypothetical protein